MAFNSVVAAMANPTELEALYHEDSALFAHNLKIALELHPQSQILKYWQVRLDYQDHKRQAKAERNDQQLGLLLLLALTAFLLLRIPLFFGLDPEWLLPRFLPWIVFAALIAYNGVVHAVPRVTLITVTGSMMLLAIVVGLFPDMDSSDTVTMALLHMPVLLWCLLGVMVTAGNWRDSYANIDFLQYCGELFILTVLILLGGAVLSGVTMGLFSLLGLQIEEWYMTNVGLAGGVSAPLVAGFIYDSVLRRRSHFANLIARLFAPLFLVMVVVYLITMALARLSPYSDRNFLILFNALLLLVLGMTIYCIGGRREGKESPLMDVVNFSLLTVTLAVNLVALSAIVFRLSSFGFTPNRIVVTGANLLIFAHLAQLLWAYLRLLRKSASGIELQKAVTGFLPVYGLWAAVVILLIPLLYSFQ